MGAPTIAQAQAAQDATDNSTNFTLTLSSAVTAGNLLAVFHFNRNEDPGSMSISDNKVGNTYTSRISAYLDPHGVRIYTCPVVGGGSGFAITVAKSGLVSTSALAVYELSGWDGTTANDGTAVAATGTTTASSVVMNATSFATDLLLTGIVSDDTAFKTFGTIQTGWTADLSGNVSGTAQQIATGKQTTSSTGTFTAGWPSSSSSGSKWAVAAIAIKGLLVIPPPPPSVMARRMQVFVNDDLILI